jgi:hypothetical protein
MKTLKEYPIVKVEFSDAVIEHNYEESELPLALVLAPYFAVGFKVAESKDVVAIAQGILPATKEHPETYFRSVLSIPKVCIVNIQTVAEI